MHNVPSRICSIFVVDFAIVPQLQVLNIAFVTPRQLWSHQTSLLSRSLMGLMLLNRKYGKVETGRRVKQERCHGINTSDDQ